MVLRWFHSDLAVFYCGVRVGGRGNAQMVFQKTKENPTVDLLFFGHYSGVFRARPLTPGVACAPYTAGYTHCFIYTLYLRYHTNLS
jgi:hypothetical protein